MSRSARSAAGARRASGPPMASVGVARSRENGDGEPCGGTGVGGGRRPFGRGERRRTPAWADDDQRRRRATAAAPERRRLTGLTRLEVLPQVRAQQGLLELAGGHATGRRASARPHGAHRGSSGGASARRAPRRTTTRGRRSACTSSGGVARSRTGRSPSRSTGRCSRRRRSTGRPSGPCEHTMPNDSSSLIRSRSTPVAADISSSDICRPVGASASSSSRPTPRRLRRRQPPVALDVGSLLVGAPVDVLLEQPLLDHLERQVLVALHPQDRLQPLDVVDVELAVARTACARARSVPRPRGTGSSRS